MAKRSNSRDKGQKGRSTSQRTQDEVVHLPQELCQRLWDYLQTVGHRPVGVPEIGRTLHLDMSDQRKLRRFFKQKVREGHMTPFRGGRFLLQEKFLGQDNIWLPSERAASRSDERSRSSRSQDTATQRGVLHVHPKGFGFVQRVGEEKSLFVPPQYIHGALHGDEVVVEENPDTGRGTSARVLQVSKPFSGHLVGQVYRKNNQLIFRSDNERYPTLPAVWQGLREEGKEGQWAIGEVTRSPWDPDHIWVEIHRWLPSQEGPALDRARSSVLLDMDAFPPEVLAEAEAVAQPPTPEVWEGRLDLRDHLMFTIDGEDARDFDDAVGIEILDNGLRRVTVAIADVSHYVKEGTLLNEEALRRATSVYFPASCLPMLPEALSNNICSLRPYEDRLVMVAILDYNDNAECVHSELHEGVMHSHARLTYKLVADRIDNPDGLPDDHPTAPLREPLLALHQLTRQLRARRLARGSIDLDLPEPKVILSEDGEIEDIRRSERHDSNQLVEELMLQANEAVARFFLKHDIPGIYRVHDEPNDEKITAYIELLERLGLYQKVDFERDAQHSHSHIWELDPRFFGIVIQSIEGHPAQQLLHQMLLRSMKQAFYSAENTGHFGLGSQHYLHFTSPIRRYPDLAVHRMLRQYLRGELPRRKNQREELVEQLSEIATHSSARERLAMQAEREVLQRYRARFLQRFLGMEFNGTVTAVAPFGLFVELDDFFVEGLLHTRNLPGEYNFDDQVMAMIGPRSGDRFQLGDRLRILIEDASPVRGEIDFTLVERLSE